LKFQTKNKNKMIELDLVEDFIVFLKEKGKVEEAEEMEATYKKFKEDMNLARKDVEEKLADFKDMPQRNTDELIAKTKDGVITLEDCDFITCAILPNGNMHIVDIDPEDIKDLIADMGHFRVHEKSIGKAEPNLGYFESKPNDKYLN